MRADGVRALKGVHMSELKEMERILYVELKQYGESFPQAEYLYYSLFGSKSCDSNYVLLCDQTMYICEDFKSANEVIAKSLESGYENLIGGTVENKHSNNGYNMEIKKDGCSLSIKSKYIDVFKSIVGCLEETASDKYDTCPRFGKGSVVYLTNEKCTVEEVNLVKAKDFSGEIDQYKYEYEYVLLTETGYTRKMSEEELAGFMEDI